MTFHTAFGAYVAAHWQQNYPDVWKTLGPKAPRFADDCATKACEYFEAAVLRGETAEVAYRFAESAWMVPFERKPAGAQEILTPPRKAG